MKIWTSILVAGAILAFAAPSAFSAGTAIPGDSKSGSAAVITVGPNHLVKGKLQNQRQAARIKALKAKNSALKAKNKALAQRASSLSASSRTQSDTISALNARIWELTGPHVSYTVEPDPDADCRDYMVCTPEQDCRLWGNQCALVTPPVTDESSKESDTGSGSES